MKKIINTVAVTVLLASTANTNAYTFVDNEKFKYTLKGDWQVQFRQKVGSDKDLDIEYDDLELKNSVTYKLGNGITAFGQLDLATKSGDTKREEAYVGLGFGKSKIKVGDTDTAADEFGVEGMIEDTGIGEDMFDLIGATSGDDLVRFETKLGNADLVLSHDLEVGDDDFTETSIFVGTKLGPFGVGFAYQTAEEGDAEAKTWGIQGKYKLNSIGLFADYSSSDITGTFEDFTGDVTHLNVGAKIKSGKNKFTLGMNQLETDGAEDIRGWYANVSHTLTKNVSAFAEVADNDGEDQDVGYLAGMRIKF